MGDGWVMDVRCMDGWVGGCVGGWVDGWVGGQHCVDHDSAVKRREAQTQAATWRDLEPRCSGGTPDPEGHTVWDSVDRTHPEQASPESQEVGL